MKTKKQSGFIALFFILSISFTFLTWISLSSERVFEYIEIKKIFNNNKKRAYDIVSCANVFINNNIKSRYSLSIKDQSYSFYRNLQFDDDYVCQVDYIDIIFTDSSIDKIIFTIDGFRFEYMFKKGFVDFIKSSALF